MSRALDLGRRVAIETAGSAAVAAIFWAVGTLLQRGNARA